MRFSCSVSVCISSTDKRKAAYSGLLIFFLSVMDQLRGLQYPAP